MPAIAEKILLGVENTLLFYPHSAHDFSLPIQLFSPFVTDFCFADLSYFGPENPADKAAPLLDSFKDYKFLEADIQGTPTAEMKHRPYRFMEPCRRTESYHHIKTGKIIRLHRRRGFSACAFHELESIGVFFYRRDSSEGSSTAWLKASNWSPRKRQRWLIHEVIDKIVDNGLIVTDGSRCYGEHNPYKGFRQFSCNQKIGGREAVTIAKPFVDDEGRSFKCVGYAGCGNGPTLIWQVSKAG